MKGYVNLYDVKIEGNGTADLVVISGNERYAVVDTENVYRLRMLAFDARGRGKAQLIKVTREDRIKKIFNALEKSVL